MEITTRYPGSFGEIIQGSFKGKDILCSCPINLFTEVKIFECDNIINKNKYNKTRNFIANLLKVWGFEKYINHIDVDIESNIPKGKGFASSTADLCAAYYGLLKLFNKQYSQQELIENCIKIEPTDSIIFNDLTLFDYKKGEYKHTIGPYFQFNILVFEGNKVVDTVEFNKKVLPSLSNIDDLVEELIKGINQKDLGKIAYCATESIVRNSKRLNYSILPLVNKIKNETGGLGIIGAHSGDALGIIYDNEIDFNYIKKYESLLECYKIYNIKTIEHIL